nr:hypothetical protein GCM10020092_076500 [Actinoplanes digitatis]
MSSPRSRSRSGCSATSSAQLGDQVPVVAEGEVDLDAVLDRADAALGEAVALGVQQRAGQAVQERAAPRFQGGVQRPGGGRQVTRRARRAGPGQLPVEVGEVEAAVRQDEPVAGVAPGEHAGLAVRRAHGFQAAPQRGDVLLQQVDGVGRGILAPDGLDQLLAAEGAVRVQRQGPEHDPLLHRAEPPRLVAAPGEQRPQHLQPDPYVARIGHCSALPMHPHCCSPVDMA